jgi:hypothetical protein
MLAAIRVVGVDAGGLDGDLQVELRPLLGVEVAAAVCAASSM